MKQLLLLLCLSPSPLTVLAGSVQSFFFLLFWVLTGLAIVESSFCNLRSHHHFFLFFFSLSLARSLYHGFHRLLRQHFSLCTFSGSFCIFSLSLSLSLCILVLLLISRAFQYTDSSLRDGLYCHPRSYCCQVVNHSLFENVIGFCSLLSNILMVWPATLTGLQLLFLFLASFFFFFFFGYFKSFQK